METSITRQEFNELLKSSEIEVFEADKVLGWLSEVLKSAGNLTLSEISAAKVEYDSLSQLTVVMMILRNRSITPVLHRLRNVHLLKLPWME